MEKVFGYPQFDTDGRLELTTYANAYRAMQMDISVWRIPAGETRHFGRRGEECAVLLLSGAVTVSAGQTVLTGSRRDVFADNPSAVHAGSGLDIAVTTAAPTEILTVLTPNPREFPPVAYEAGAIVWQDFGTQYGGTGSRRVNTIFDYDRAPQSNLVLGETVNAPGNWSGFTPHRHPQPEAYFFKFDRPEGFGASFVGDRVFRSVNNSFAAIPGGLEHPQAVAPGYRMYTCWLIRHLDGNPWRRSSCTVDPCYAWQDA